MAHPRRLPVAPDTLFDCASLTKPLVTAALARRLDLDLDRPIALGGRTSPFPWGIPTARQLMNHRAGLPRWRPVYALGPDPATVLRRLPSLQEAPPESRVEYSCPGYILLGRWIELIAGTSLADLAEKRLFGPLGLKGQAFFPLPPEFPRERVAAAELGNGIEFEMSGRRAPRRASPIWGEVHDGNALFFGGAAGNAGLFATAAAVGALARAAWVEEAGGGPPGTYLMGFKVGGAGTCFPEGTLGHNGFTGTSVCLHLRTRNKISLLLTNRLHRRRPKDIFPLRKHFHAWGENQG